MSKQVRFDTASQSNRGNGKRATRQRHVLTARRQVITKATEILQAARTKYTQRLDYTRQNEFVLQIRHDA